MGRFEFRFLLPAVLLLSGCSDAPKEDVKTPPEKPSAPITGRQGMQMTYPSARAWAADATPIRVRSLDLDSLKGEGGKSPVWEVTYVSPAKGRIRVFNWSAAEEGNLHKGVHGPADDAWGGPSGQERMFPPTAIESDTSAALQTATENSETYLKKPGQKPPVSYLLQLTPRYPNPTWLVLWGSSPGTAEHTVTVDAATGKMLAHD
jgi:hypothetical protein